MYSSMPASIVSISVKLHDTVPLYILILSRSASTGSSQVSVVVASPVVPDRLVGRAGAVLSIVISILVDVVVLLAASIATAVMS